MEELPIIDPFLAKRYPLQASNFINELLDLFIAHIPETQNQIIQAFDQKSIPLLREQLHKLQGACLYCGLLRLQKTVTSFQSHIRQGIFETEQLNRLKIELYQVIKMRAQQKDSTHTII